MDDWLMIDRRTIHDLFSQSGSIWYQFLVGKNNAPRSGKKNKSKPFPSGGPLLGFPKNAEKALVIWEYGDSPRVSAMSEKHQKQLVSPASQQAHRPPQRPRVEHMLQMWLRCLHSFGHNLRAGWDTGMTRVGGWGNHKKHSSCYIISREISSPELRTMPHWMQLNIIRS